jgi:hypothetical protein
MSLQETGFQVLYSNATSGYPAGTPMLKIKHEVYKYEDGVATACFERKLDSGHMPIETVGSIIWATGPVTATGITYHGADGHDETGKTQSHRSDETPIIPWVGKN